MRSLAILERPRALWRSFLPRPGEANFGRLKALRKIALAWLGEWDRLSLKVAAWKTATIARGARFTK
jgi:hypothetical protein